MVDTQRDIEYQAEEKAERVLGSTWIGWPTDDQDVHSCRRSVHESLDTASGQMPNRRVVQVPRSAIRLPMQVGQSGTLAAS
jgi:hypothetical protein